jgi:hypothetical protein
MDNILLPSQILQTILYSDNVVSRQDQHRQDPGNERAQDYLEASFAANVPSFPLQDPFLNAYNYKNTVYLAISCSRCRG